MNNINKDTLIKLLVIAVVLLGYLYFFNNDCKSLKDEIEQMENQGKCEGTVTQSGSGFEGGNCSLITPNDGELSVPGCVEDIGCNLWLQQQDSTSNTRTQPATPGLNQQHQGLNQ